MNAMSVRLDVFAGAEEQERDIEELLRDVGKLQQQLEAAPKPAPSKLPELRRQLEELERKYARILRQMAGE